ncbi:MAG TPA: AI-2E family transporter [Polyangiaceae bacterium]|nr:AI-2E family transporter [Polyangiaceae bacterium]
MTTSKIGDDEEVAEAKTTVVRDGGPGPADTVEPVESAEIPRPTVYYTPIAEDQVYVRRAVEATIRIAVLAAIVVWCFRIAEPFIAPMLWGAVIAVAIYPAYIRVEALLGGRRVLTAVLFALVSLTLLIVPSVLLADSLATGLRKTAEAFRAGELHVPPPSDSVKSWPVIGARVHEVWLQASVNLREALLQFKPQLAEGGKWLIGALASTGGAVLQFALSTIIAAVFLAQAKPSARLVRAFAIRLSPTDGRELAEAAERTLRSVAIGVLGVALLQGLLAGAGFLAAGVPAAGLLTLLCIILAVVQVGVVLVMVGVAIYLFASGDTTTAIAFSAWTLVVAPVDNILRPLLLGRGTNVPMLVVFIGAIGGFISSGLIGLFLGGVIFTLGYTLFKAWVGLGPTAPAIAAEPAPAGDAGLP